MGGPVKVQWSGSTRTTAAEAGTGPPTDVAVLDARGGPGAGVGWIRSGVPLAALGGGLAGAVLFLLAHRGLPDDTYITLDYARNLVEHGHWGLTAFRDANSATSPLNVWLLAAGILVVGRPVVALGLLLVLTTALTAVWAVGLAREVGLRPPAVAGLVVGLIVTSPLFASVVGMESFLVAALLVGVARYAVPRRPVAAGVVTGLAVLARPDLVLPAVVVVAVLFLARAPRRPRQALLALGVGAAVALPWHVWSWFVLGSFVPDSLIIKTGGAFPGGEVFGNGPLFILARQPLPTLLVAAVAVTGLAVVVVAAVAWTRGRDRPVDRVVVACGLGALAHYGAYTVLGVSSYLWYYSPSLALLTVCAALGAADLADRRTGLAVTGLGVLAGVSVGLQIAGGVPWSVPVYYGNWATAAQYQAAGHDLAAVLPPGAAVEAPGEIGGLAYACECDIVDGFADSARVRALATERAAQAGPLSRLLLRVNYLHGDDETPRPVQYVVRWERGVGPGSPTDVPGLGAGRLFLDTPRPGEAYD